MTFEPPQMGLPPHVVRHILAAPSRWFVGGDLLKKQLKKLTTNEAAVTRFLNNARTNRAYFPVMTSGEAPRFDYAKYPKYSGDAQHVTDNIYVLTVA